MSELTNYSTVQEAADFLGVSQCRVRQLLRRLCGDGNPRLPGGIRVGRLWLISNKVLAEFKANTPPVQWRPRPADQKAIVRLTGFVHLGPFIVGGLRGTACGHFYRPTFRVTNDRGKVTCRTCLARIP